jgi:hypothetical protein
MIVPQLAPLVKAALGPGCVKTQTLFEVCVAT